MTFRRSATAVTTLSVIVVIAAADMIAAMPAVKRAFAARDRAELLAVTRDAFQIQHDR